jgi:PIN domain nuclease of toxin-antitoxin system
VSPVLLDTHVWAWALGDGMLLSDRARAAIQSADAVYVSPISFFEIGQKVRLGKWPEMAPHAANLPAILNQQGGIAAPFTPEICIHASLRDWEHRDPFDRMLASTAQILDLTLISKDAVFADLPGLRCIW